MQRACPALEVTEVKHWPMGEAGTKPVCSATEADKSKTSAEPELNPPVTGGMFSLLVLPRLRESSAGSVASSLTGKCRIAQQF